MAIFIKTLKMFIPGFPVGIVVESASANARDMRSSPGLGRSHGLQSS